MIVTGCARNGIVRVWDKRVQNECVKELSVSTRSTPVYCLTFDQCGLYAALESSLFMVDFNHFAKNYSADGCAWIRTLTNVNFS
jgi:hypothetical protein